MSRIVHICPSSPIIPKFIDFVFNHFDINQHFFYIPHNIKTEHNQDKNIGYFTSDDIFKLTIKANLAKKIIIHGLFNYKIIFFFFLQPWLLKKCYWGIWGGDLYYYQFRKKTFKSDLLEKIRGFVIKRMGYLVTYVKGDYELAQKWYCVCGQYYECFMYPSNLYKEYDVPPKTGNKINILVGNSADPTNNHLEIFEKLNIHKNEDITIYCPLSYGNAGYAKEIAQKGQEQFSNKFVPLLDFMPFQDYLKILGQIDIAIFAHKRQQAMGNTITLLGLGKKVYLRHDVTPWQTFEELGIKVFDVDNIELSNLKTEIQLQNIKKVKEHFSKENFIKQLEKIFG